MSWAEVKAKQAENIAKLYEKDPDDWFLQSQMSRPKEERTGFSVNIGGKTKKVGKNPQNVHK